MIGVPSISLARSVGRGMLVPVQTVQIDSLTTTGTVTVRVASQATLSAEQARSIFLSLDTGVTRYRGLCCEYDDTDEVCVWSCDLEIDGDWYPATMEDHWPDGAEVHWSEAA